MNDDRCKHHIFSSTYLSEFESQGFQANVKLTAGLNGVTDYQQGT